MRYLRELTAAGARLHGAADPAFATVRVLRRLRDGRSAAPGLRRAKPPSSRRADGLAGRDDDV